MRIGYGHKRREADLIAEGCEKVWIDGEDSERIERADMLKALREGDVLVVLSMGDLARGGERLTILPLIEERGATVELAQPEKAARQVGGRPPVFDPNADQDNHIRTLWQDRTLALSYVLRRASKIMGWPVKHHHLRHRYGGRRAVKR